MASLTFKSKFFHISSENKTQYLQTDNFRDPLIVCLHGLGGSVSTSKPLIPSLPKEYNVVLIDFQGFGQKPLTSSMKPLPFSGHVSDVHDLVAFLQRDGKGIAKGGKIQVISIAHSLGGIIALHYAVQYPPSVAGLALLGVGRSANHIPAAHQRMLDVAESTSMNGIEFTAEKSVPNNFPPQDQRDVPAKFIGEVRKAIAASEPEGYARTCQLIVDPSHFDPEYSKTTCPVVFVSGDLDVISPLQKAQSVSKELCGPSSIEAVKSGHQPLIDSTEATTEAILKFLEKVEKSFVPGVALSKIQ